MRHIAQLGRIKSSLSPSWSLDEKEVASRRNQYGTNDIIQKRTNRWWMLALDTAKDPMIWFLIVTSFLFAILGSYNQSIILLLATIPLMGMDAFLHWRTQASTQGLSTRLATEACVIRNGSKKMVASWELVPGDLVSVSTGSSIPADGLIVEGKDLQVDESSLTGEAFPVRKAVVTHIAEATLTPAIDGLYWGFAGTRLLTGSALLRVIYTGKQTIYGEIVSSTLESTHTQTPLQKAIGHLVFVLIIISVIFCIVLAIIRFYQGFGMIDAILSAATLAVAALPDEFPIVFTFFLGVGVYRLAMKKALVKRAVSVENIGRTTYICADKTGTMTEGYFQISQSLPAAGFNEKEVLFIAMLASRQESGDPLDVAITEDVNKEDLGSFERVATFPFTEARKRETSIIKQKDQFLAATKGAPETIINRCTLSQEEQNDWLKRVFELASGGNKILACAQYIQPTSFKNEPENNYQFVGLLIFTDPPRKGVPEAIKICKESNIHVLMITGDHMETARAIACRIGLGGEHPRVILAEDIKAHQETNSHLETVSGNHHDIAKDYFRTIDVIARAIPSQKLAIVTSLQKAGEIVAVTGDGVNDVPALKAADIGIAMGERGTQSAREVASIVLLDDNFESIVNAVSEGRQLFKNLQASFKYLLLIHIPLVLTAAAVPLFGFPILYYPIHVVILELIIHPTAMLVFQDLPAGKKLAPIDEIDTNIHFFKRIEWIKLFIIGGLAAIVMMLSYIWTLNANHSEEHARAMTVGLLCLISVTFTVALSELKNKTSIVLTVTVLLLTWCVIQIPSVSVLLNFTPLSYSNWLFMLVTSIVLAMLVKIRV